jgi:nitrite reductase (NO-forming) / hydroxylamine reductase
VHISRPSASGRYVYTIGRDGKIDMIDLFMNPPQRVAEIKIGLEARSVETSKAKGFEDRYAIAGAYWPPQYVIMDGMTLEPMKIVSTRGMTGRRPRSTTRSRASPPSSPRMHPGVHRQRQGDRPDQAGQLRRHRQSERNHHRCGPVPARWRLGPHRRYFLTAANQSDKMAVVDARRWQTLEALVDTVTGDSAPGRGANLIDPEYGPVWVTSALGSDEITFIGTDPGGHPERPGRR